jgi:23S rRNA pseudouridine2605 synthase
MFEALGLTVSRLMRVRFGIVALPPALKRGTWTELKDSEIRKLLEWVGGEHAKPAMPSDRPMRQQQPNSRGKQGENMLRRPATRRTAPR